AGYYDFNNIGSTVGITGTTGRSINSYVYLPLGQTTTIVAHTANSFTFVGQFGVTVDGSGSLNMRFREYDPGAGQFFSNDPLGLASADTNLRRYVANNPVNSIDPQGLCSHCDQGTVMKVFNDLLLIELVFGTTPVGLGVLAFGGTALGVYLALNCR